MLSCLYDQHNIMALCDNRDEDGFGATTTPKVPSLLEYEILLIFLFINVRHVGSGKLV